MKRDKTWLFVAGVLFAFLVVLLIEGLFLPEVVGPSMIPMGVFAVILWLYGYRVSRKNHSE